ncbi:hypothetical protein N0V83_005829 [Neocucurbitaria cava]|uniref:Uncharacterized protein n=1 Tax=Neocucurbitaria cava TaxID=798079 RepID=A0A9W9CLM8_9PLEO|nr:hypothetical protein N0V83_005829 [Neocucurbitaria cava]
MPLDLEDEYITKEGLSRQPRSLSSEPPTSITGAIHVVKLRRLWSKFADNLYPTTTKSSVSHSTSQHVLAGHLRQELEEWHAAIPETVDYSGSHPLSVFASKAWFQLAYDHSVLLLYRHYITLPPQPGEEESVEKAFEECAIRSRERWSQAATYRDIFETLSEKTISMICNNQSQEVHPGNDSADFGLDFTAAQSAVSQEWIMGLDDMPVPNEPGWFVQELLQGMRDYQQPDITFDDLGDFHA